MSGDEGRLGELVVGRGLATRRAVLQTLYYQRKLAEGGIERRLGEILVGLDLVARADIEECGQILETHRLDREALRAEVQGVSGLAEQTRIANADLQKFLQRAEEYAKRKQAEAEAEALQNARPAPIQWHTLKSALD